MSVIENKMIQGSEVANTQIRPLVEGSTPEGDAILQCFDAILSGLSGVVRHVTRENGNYSLGLHVENVRQEAERLYLWGDGHSIRTGNLNVSLLCSTDLRLAVLSRLYELGTVTKDCLLPCICVQGSATLFLPEMNNLEARLNPISKILQENDQEVIDYSPPEPPKDRSDLSGPLGDIHVLIDCLMDLSLAIEDCSIASNHTPGAQKQYQKVPKDSVPQTDKQSTPEAPTLQDEYKREASYSPPSSLPEHSGASSTYTAPIEYTSPREDAYNIYQPPTAGTYLLPCEFVGIESCDIKFNFEDTEAWVEHIIRDHLQDKLPHKADCWFCDDYSFDIKDPRVHNDRRLNFDCRMKHIRNHIADGKTVHDMKPDFRMLDHLLKHNLISKGPWHGVQAKPFEHMRETRLGPFGKQRQAERTGMVQTDHNKEERQRKKDMNDRKKR